MCLQVQLGYGRWQTTTLEHIYIPDIKRHEKILCNFKGVYTYGLASYQTTSTPCYATAMQNIIHPEQSTFSLGI